MRKNRRGFLLGEFTLKVIVAVMCIVLLVFLSFKLYETFTSKTDVEKADGTLTRVLEKVTEASVNGQSDYVLLSPKGWILVYSEEGKPAQCQGQKCLCLCEAGSAFDNIKMCTSFNNCKDVAYSLFNEQLTKCNGAGACQKVQGNIELPEMIKADTTQIYFLYNANDKKVVISKTA